MVFQITAQDRDSSARCGILKTDHGTIETPIFMPVGTVGSVKAVCQRDLKEDIGAQIILGNTYHLYLRPGLDIIERVGGLHNFISWEWPILTDSGGFQIFSLAEKRKLTREGAIFRSHIDGSKHIFTPEGVVDIQRKIGADIIMAFDECPPATADYRYIKESLNITKEWLERGVKQFRQQSPLYGYSQLFFPIVQGGLFDDLRIESALHAISMEMEGYAVGGLSVGEPAQEMYRILELLDPTLPKDKPRYLMGVGTPANILEAIERGVDMFDCVMPTRNGRNGMLFTSEGIINIRNRKWAEDYSPIEKGGSSYVDEKYSKGYLRHLFIAGEILGAQIASLHNLAFYLNLVKEAREHIAQGSFREWKRGYVKNLERRL